MAVVGNVYASELNVVYLCTVGSKFYKKTVRPALTKGIIKEDDRGRRPFRCFPGFDLILNYSIHKKNVKLLISRTPYRPRPPPFCRSISVSSTYLGTGDSTADKLAEMFKTKSIFFNCFRKR
jgi:hypothetical protein